MAHLLLLILVSWASAAEVGPRIDKTSCAESDAKKIEESWPEARRRVKAARDAVNSADKGEDPAQRIKIIGYFNRMLGIDFGGLSDAAYVLGLMDGIIEKAVYVCGAKSDKSCRSRAGYVRRSEQEDGKGVVHLCPSLFSEKDAEDEKRSREQLVRTMTHESAHLVGRGISQPEGEGYCIVFDCDTPCPGKTPYLVADNWAHFTHCASGEKPDGGFEIVGRPKKR